MDSTMSLEDEMGSGIERFFWWVEVLLSSFSVGTRLLLGETDYALIEESILEVLAEDEDADREAIKAMFWWNRGWVEAVVAQDDRRREFFAEYRGSGE